MAHINKKIAIPIITISILALGGWYLDSIKEKSHNNISGFFETQPETISSRITGRVKTIPVFEGDQVKTGDIILELEAAPSEYDLQSKIYNANQAEALYKDTRQGARQEEIMRQRYVVEELSSILLKLKKGPQPEEIGAAKNRMDLFQALYEKAVRGARPEEIKEARAGEKATYEKWMIAKRGLTQEEIQQYKARLDFAKSQIDYINADAARYQDLYNKEAISKQQLDNVLNQQRQSQARLVEAEEAYNRAKNGTPVEELNEAYQQYLQAKAKTDLILNGSRQEDIIAAKKQYLEARNNWLLLAKGSRSEDIAAAQARLDQAKEALNQLINGNRSNIIKAAKDAAQSANAIVKSTDQVYKERFVRSPSNGIIERVYVAKGDLIPADTPILRIIDNDNIWIRVYIPESKLAAIQVGQHAAITVDGINQPIDMIVDSIAPQGEFTPVNLQTADERGKQVFGVRLHPAKPDNRLKAGMYASLISIGVQNF